jgi:hypothetical protein
MRPGILELGLIILIVLVIFVATRSTRSRGNRKEEGDNTSGDDTTKNGKDTPRVKHPLLGKAGFALIIIGILVLLVSVSVLKWVFWGSIWALIIALAGLAVILVARR